jgi:hypothetical protein
MREQHGLDEFRFSPPNRHGDYMMAKSAMVLTESFPVDAELGSRFLFF